MSVILAPLLAILCLQASAGPAITGTVMDESQTPLAGIEVLLSLGTSVDGAVPVSSARRPMPGVPFSSRSPRQRRGEGWAGLQTSGSIALAWRSGPTRAACSRRSSTNPFELCSKGQQADRDRAR